MTENINLHLNILHRISFLMLRTFRRLQDILSGAFWKIFVLPVIYIGWKIWGVEGKKSKILDLRTEFLLPKLYWRLCKHLFSINSTLSGLKNRYNFYDLLLRWNPSIPLPTLRNKKTNYVLHVLGKENSERKGSFPLIDTIFVQHSSLSGSFKIINKKLDSNKEVVIECVWVSGEKTGESFEVDKLGGLNKEDQETPDIIYFPPAVIIWSIDTILSVGAIVTLGGIAYHLWGYFLDTNYYNSFIKNILGL